RGMRSVAQWIHNGDNIVWYCRIHFDDVARRQSQVFGKSPIPVYAYANSVFTNMSATATAIPAHAACNMAFARYALSNGKPNHFLANGLDHSHIFMSYYSRDFDRILGPGIPFINMDIGAANGCLFYFDQHIVYADGWFIYFVHPYAFFCLSFYKSLHAVNDLRMQK